MPYPLINGAPINENSEVQAAAGLRVGFSARINVVQSARLDETHPVLLGALVAQPGIPERVLLPGLEVVRTGLMSVALTQPPSSITLVVSGANPLTISALSVRTDTDKVVGLAGTNPVALGTPFTSVSARLAPKHPMSFGGAAALIVGVRLSAQYPVRLGAPSAPPTAAGVPSLNMVRTEPASFAVGGISARFAGKHPVELGAHGTPSQRARMRQRYPISLGIHAVSRGTTC